MPNTVARLNSALEGRYHLERKLGEGGMAAVYLADDLRHERKVAVKVLKPELAAVVGAERFLAEIKTTANLQHPHILPLFDSGEADGNLFYVMPYVEGETLRDRLGRERQLPIPDAVRIAENMAEALDYAHQRGVVHRDIKSANVLMQAGRPVIADFGIALAVNKGSGARLTETGLSLGTPHYMSPEQATGDQRVGPATDVYALGCVLYEMLAGSPPYTGGTAQAVLGQILTGDAKPVTEHRATVPPNVAASVRCALEKVPADRFASGDDFAQALRNPSFRHGTESRGAHGGSRWNPLTLALASALILLLVYIGVSGRSAGGPDSRVHRYILSLGDAPVLPVQFGGGVRISPDGSTLAYIGPTEGGGKGVFIKEASQLTARPIAALGRAAQLAFSPDGTRLAGISTGGRGLAAVSLATGELQVVADSGVWAGEGAWSDDGWIYVQSDRATIVRYAFESGLVEDVTELDADEVEHVFPDVLPGGHGMVFTVWRATPEFEGARIAVTEIGSGAHRVVAQGNKAIYSNTGHLLVLRSDGSVHAAPFDARTMEVKGAFVPLLDGVSVGEYASFDFTLSRTGDLIYSGLGESQLRTRELVWVDRDGNERPLDEDWDDQFESVAISPGGDRIAVTIGIETTTTIWLKEVVGGPASRFTFSDGLNRRPVWTEDGESILFISDRGGNRALYSKRADGTGTVVPVLELQTHVDQASRRSGEGWIAYRTGIAGEDRDIFAVRPGVDSVGLPISAGEGVDEHTPTLSPDGRYIAYVSDEGGEEQVWVRPFPQVMGGRWLVSPGGGVEPVWARDGRELFFRGGGSLIAARVRTEGAFAVTGIDTLFSARRYFGGGVHPGYDVSPGGERFLMIRVGAPDVDQLIVVEGFAEEIERRVPR